MMKRFFVIILVLFEICSDNTNFVEQNKRFGTTILFATGTDGIILASDTRSSTYYDDQQKHMKSYSDGFEKIYLINGFPIAVYGVLDLGNKSIGEVINDFNIIGRSQLEGANVEATFGYFISYMKQVYPVEKYPYLLKSGFYCVGYVGDSAYLIGYRYKQTKGLAWDSLGSNHLATDSMLRKVYKRTDSKKLAVIIEKTMKSYLSIFKIKTSGGPITIVKIDKNNIVIFLQNDFRVIPFKNNQEHKVPFDSLESK